MKHIIEFNLPEESTELEMAQNGMKYYIMLEDIRNEIFRPARKYGYSEQNLNELLEKLGEDGYTLISLLEDKFNNIVTGTDV